MQLKFSAFIALATLASNVRAICPGFNFGIADLGHADGTTGESYAVYDDSCKRVASAVVDNPCDAPMFSCSPPPITFNGLHLYGLDYACRPDPNAGVCDGNVIQVCCRNDGR